MDKNNILTDSERKEYEKLKGLEKFSKLVGKELSEENKKTLENYRKRIGELMDNSTEDNREISQELIDFRKMWEKQMNVSDENKEKIIQAAEKIPIEAKIEEDGSKLIRFKTGGKEYKILDVNLDINSDDEYKRDYDYAWMSKQGIKLGGMRGDDVDRWYNRKLVRYVKKKQKEGFKMPEKEDIEQLLIELGNNAGINKKSFQIAMLMYLTGMYGPYWLDWNYSASHEYCHRLSCQSNNSRGFGTNNHENNFAGFFMMACK